MEKLFCVYILTNKSNNVLYIGVTSNLVKRIYEHKNHLFTNSYTDRYNVDKLVYFESGFDAENAIAREKYLKGKSRQYKIDLIKSNNPNFDDLFSSLL